MPTSTPEFSLDEIQEHAKSEVNWLKSLLADNAKVSPMLSLMEEFGTLVHSDSPTVEQAEDFTARLFDLMVAEGGKGPPDYLWYAEAFAAHLRQP